MIKGDDWALFLYDESLIQHDNYATGLLRNRLLLKVCIIAIFCLLLTVF